MKLRDKMSIRWLSQLADWLYSHTKQRLYNDQGILQVCRIDQPHTDIFGVYLCSFIFIFMYEQGLRGTRVTGRFLVYTSTMTILYSKQKTHADEKLEKRTRMSSVDDTRRHHNMQQRTRVFYQVSVHMARDDGTNQTNVHGAQEIYKYIYALLTQQ